jgi:hypothetical protein
MSLEELAAIQKNGQRPVLLHGIKTPDGRMNAQRLISNRALQLSP